jgi:hypothetical protein
MTDIDRYAGLIVSMHRTGLWRNRYDLMSYPSGYNIREVSHEVREFIERNERWQHQERKSHDPEKLRTNYQLMQTWDLLGLYFGCRELTEDCIDPVPIDYSNNSAQLKMRPSGPQQVRFDPFPFDTTPLRIQLAFKRLSRTSFQNTEEFQRAYFRAEVDLLHFELIGL